MSDGRVPQVPLNVEGLQFFRHFIEIINKIINLAQLRAGAGRSRAKIALRNLFQALGDGI